VEEPEERQRGMWTREKGDKEALSVMKKMRSGKADDDRAEGVREFVRLVDMRFGSGAERRKEEQSRDLLLMWTNIGSPAALEFECLGTNTRILLQDMYRHYGNLRPSIPINARRGSDRRISHG
jgi:hypothetical protein